MHKLLTKLESRLAAHACRLKETSFWQLQSAWRPRQPRCNVVSSIYLMVSPFGKPFVLKNSSPTCRMSCCRAGWNGFFSTQTVPQHAAPADVCARISPALLAFTDCRLQELSQSDHSTSSASIAASAAALSLRLSPWLSAISAIRLASCCLVYSGWVAAHRCRSGPQGM